VRRIPVGPLVKFLIFGIVTMLATAVLGLTIANAQSGPRTTYTARFSDVAGLLKGDDVRIAGVTVGSVDDIKIVDPTPSPVQQAAVGAGRPAPQAEVTFEVDSALRLPGSTTAAVLYKNLIGQRFMSLGQGAGDTSSVLAPGGQIPMERTTPPVNLTTLFNGFKPLFTALDPNQINTLSQEIVEVLQGEGGTVESLLASTASLTSTLADRDQVIGQVIDNLNNALESVTSRNDQLNDLIVSLRELVTGLSQDRVPIGNAIASIGTLTDTTASLLQAGRPDLKNDIAALGDLSDQLNQAEPVIEKYLQFAPYKLNKIARAGSYGSWFNFYLCGVTGRVGITGLIPPIQLPDINVSAARCGADPDGHGDESLNGYGWKTDTSSGASLASSGSGGSGSGGGTPAAANQSDPGLPAGLLPTLPALGGS
jgi:phospholipid/cholesterol/gamma-HCH transport system substrate-binding protein